MAAGPVVWLLLSGRTGDDMQVLELARRLGMACTAKHLTFNTRENWTNHFFGRSLVRLTHGARASLAGPPWPDLVISLGRRTAAPARWIKRQSGGRTRLVVLGRPRSAMGDFDLILTTPQYGLPDGPRVLQLPLPLGRSEPPAVEERAWWCSQWAHLPRPWTGILVGAAKPPQFFGEAETAQLAHGLQGLTRQSGGSLIVLGSPRTQADIFQDLQEKMGGQGVFVPFSPDATLNPYRTLLAEADTFVVTSDSMSMLADVTATGKPVCVFLLRHEPMPQKINSATAFGRFRIRHGLAWPRRDVGSYVRSLVSRGALAELGQGTPFPPALGTEDADTLARIRALLPQNS